MTFDSTPDKKSKSATNALLIGFTAGLLLFGLTACTLAILFLPNIAEQWNVASGPGDDWSPPTTPTVVFAPTPTPLIPATTTPTAQAPSENNTFQVGDNAVNVHDGNVNLRQTPGYVGKGPSDRVALVPKGGSVEILGGPEKVDGLIWWYVGWRDKKGWMAETRSSGGAILERSSSD